MQGVVFGGAYNTRFDYDDYFGTVINRFCVQAVAGVPLTVYGKGGQTRGYLPLKDSLECLTLAIDNPPGEGEYRVFNQFAATYSVLELAETVKRVHGTAKIVHIDNPRVEKERHQYFPVNDNLHGLGYEPDWRLDDEISAVLGGIIAYKDRIKLDVIQPRTTWR